MDATRRLFRSRIDVNIRHNHRRGCSCAVHGSVAHLLFEFYPCELCSCCTGGIFTVDLTYKPTQSQLEVGDDPNEAKHVLLWDRKSEGGFPETKILKQRLRNIIEPEKALGHSDTPSNKGQSQTAAESTVAEGQGGSKDCEDCK